MPSLHLRHFPPELYRRLKRRATTHGHSLAAKVVAWLRQALGKPEADQAAVLAGIHGRRLFAPHAAGAPDSVELLREDRER